MNAPLYRLCRALYCRQEIEAGVGAEAVAAHFQVQKETVLRWLRSIGFFYGAQVPAFKRKIFSSLHDLPSKTLTDILFRYHKRGGCIEGISMELGIDACVVRDAIAMNLDKCSSHAET